MIKSCVLGVLLCVGTGLAVTQQQLAQYVAAQQTGLRPQSVSVLQSGSRQAYALQGAEEGDETAYQQAYQPYQQPGAYQAQPAAPAASSYKSYASSGAAPAGPLYYRPAPQAQAGPGPQYKLRPLAEKGEPEDYDPNPAYQFSFDVKDDEFTNYQNRKEQREGDKISGSYSVVDSDGYIRTVTYTADPKEGFKADVSREPTDIRIKIPQPPSALPQQYQQVPQQFVRKQQTQQYLEASSPALTGPQYSAAAPQYSGKPQGVAYVAPQFAAGPVPQYKAPSSGGLGAYGSHRLAAPVKGKAAAIGYSAQSPTAGPILYQAYQQ